MTAAEATRPGPLPVAKARAVLAGAILDGAPRRTDGEPALEELSQLVETAGGEEVARVTQRLRRPVPGTFLGRGKVGEIARLVTRERADVVVLDHDLTPAQVRNLERALGCGVIERSELILGIFARHARTKAAKLQVELARLKYVLPRLKRMWTHLERQAGGIGLRAGAGERQIETDRRKIRKRISDVAKQLRQIEARRRRIVRSRSDHFTVSLVGYTNAGKSTLMRALTGEEVRVEDKLFATLDTRTGALEPDRAGGVAPPAAVKILVSDTVGFIRDLPHGLVASFHATLEEARNASLLLHVADVSCPRFEEQIGTVDSVLREIGASEIPVVVVLNKIDLLDDRRMLGHLAERLRGSAFDLCSRQAVLRQPATERPTAGAQGGGAGAVPVSALSGEGMAALRERIVAAAARSARWVLLRLRAEEREVVRYLFNHAFNLERRYLDDGTVEAKARMRPWDLERLLGEWPSVELIDGPEHGRPA